MGAAMTARSMDPHLRTAACLLIGGWVIFWAGAMTPPWDWWYPIPAAEYLQLIDAHRWIWLWIAASFAVGVLLTLAGLVVLGTVLRGHGDRLWSELGQTAFVFGSVLWVATIVFRATATISAASETAAAGTVPAWFEPMFLWSNALFAVYMVLAYLAIAAYGRALLDTALVAPWLAKTHVIFGLAGAFGFVVRIPIFDPPLIIHLVPGILGIVLLVNGRSAKPAVSSRQTHAEPHCVVS
jgi:hypothetical protein